MSATDSLRGPNRLTGALLAVLAGVTALAYPVVPASMRIHWSLGGPYYGPETVPKLLGLLAIPAVAALVVGLMLAVGRFDAVPDAVSESRAYRLAAASLAGLLVVVQVVLVGLNAV